MDTVTQLTYQALQQGTAALSLAHKRLANQVAQLVAPTRETTTKATRPTPKPLPDGALMQVNARREKLHEIDLQDVDRGIYPASLLFDHPWLEAIATYPRIWLDLPGT